MQTLITIYWEQEEEFMPQITYCMRQKFPIFKGTSLWIIQHYCHPNYVLHIFDIY